jgi:beta-glucosidase/6-phospho-beta-glucosidase/beta-galactosidase
MLDALLWVDKRYNRPVILITENGCDILSKPSEEITVELNDTFRVKYYSSYLSSVGEAMRQGVDVRGYFAWSLLDNYE